MFVRRPELVFARGATGTRRVIRQLPPSVLCVLGDKLWWPTFHSYSWGVGDCIHHRGWGWQLKLLIDVKAFEDISRPNCTDH